MRIAILAALTVLTLAFPAAAGWNDGYGSSDSNYTPVAPDTTPTQSPAGQNYGDTQAQPPAAASTSVGHNFGTAICSQHVGCPEGGDSTLVSQLVGYANTCITQNFGYSNSSGFFEEGQSLSSDGCLTPKPNVLPKGMGAPLTTRCCIVTMKDSSCALRCELVSIQ